MHLFRSNRMCAITAKNVLSGPPEKTDLFFEFEKKGEWWLIDIATCGAPAAEGRLVPALAAGTTTKTGCRRGRHRRRRNHGDTRRSSLSVAPRCPHSPLFLSFGSSEVAAEVRRLTRERVDVRGADDGTSQRAPGGERRETFSKPVCKNPFAFPRRRVLRDCRRVDSNAMMIALRQVEKERMRLKENEERGKPPPAASRFFGDTTLRTTLVQMQKQCNRKRNSSKGSAKDQRMTKVQRKNFEMIENEPRWTLANSFTSSSCSRLRLICVAPLDRLVGRRPLIKPGKPIWVSPGINNSTRHFFIPLANDMNLL